jgi:methyl-accepting chemotaxis protein
MRLRFQGKMVAAFAVVVAVFVAASVVSLLFSGASQRKWEQTARWDRAVTGAARQEQGTRTQMAAQALYVATGDPRYRREWEDGVRLSESGAAAVAALHLAAVTKIATGANAADVKHDAVVHKTLFPAMASGDRAAATRALRDADRYVRVPLAAQERIAGVVESARAKDVASASATASNARLVAILAALSGIALAIGIAVAFSRRLAGRLRSVTAAADGLAQGDLEQHVDTRGGDELAELGSAFERMIAYQRTMTDAARRIADGDLTVRIAAASEHDTLGQAFTEMAGSLNALLGQVSGSARDVSSASQQMASTSEETGRAVGEIAAAVNDVAQGAERQVRMVESTREAVQQAAQAAAASAQVATLTSDAAGEAEQAAQDGLAAASGATDAIRALAASSEQVGGAIDELSARSERIGGIVATITGIAEQTNLLALNAAIEAARAGEQGRGFAVVAEEVRKLAEESQHAAAEISALIDEMQAKTGDAVSVVADAAQRTEHGVGTVAQTRDAFERISTAVQQVNARVSEIAAAIERIAAAAQRAEHDVTAVASIAEQSSASAEQVSASTQQTSASSQEIAATAQSLADTVAGLEQLVGRFQLNQDGDSRRQGVGQFVDLVEQVDRDV